MATTNTPIYDTDAPRRPLIDEVKTFWTRRSLISLLVVRDLTLRYKRSVLGVWWTILNPVLTTAVMWFVFSQIFTRVADDPTVPFVVYLLSGVLLISTFFAQGVIAAGSSLVNSREILSKIRVEGEIFAFTAALAAGVNFVIGLVVLAVVQVATGIGIPWTMVLVPLPAIAMLALVTGIGMMIAAAAVHFFDVLDFVRVLIQLAIWMVPTFYPIEMLPDSFQTLVKINPLYSYLVVFRDLMYGGTISPWWNFAVMIGTAIAAFVIGVWIFARSWRNLAVLL